MNNSLSVVGKFLATWFGLSIIWIIVSWVVVCIVSMVVSPIPAELTGAAKDAYIDTMSSQLMAQTGPWILVAGPLLALANMGLDARKRQREQ